MSAAYKEHPGNPMNMSWEKSSKVVMVSFMCHPDWAERCQIAGKTLLLGMSVRVFQEKRSAFESVNWVKKDLQSPTQVGIIQSNERLNRTKWHRKGKFALYLSRASTFSCPQTLALLVLRPSDLGQYLHHRPSDSWALGYSTIIFNDSHYWLP